LGKLFEGSQLTIFKDEFYPHKDEKNIFKSIEVYGHIENKSKKSNPT